MARPERFELPTLWFEARCSIQLSYGRVPPSYQNLQAARRIAPFRSHGNERNCEGGNAIGAIAVGFCCSDEHKVSHFVDSSPCRSVRSKRSEKMMNPNGRKTSIGAERLHSATALLSRTRDRIQISDTSRKQSRELHRQMRHSS